ncbi:OPT/YSL family transporter [Eubacteriales bacterium OttesenSCG-928-K08]|nr:OPT/YSL family transporter [Eubacteriales bacterium OttesenSCG-928-K08]
MQNTQKKEREFSLRAMIWGVVVGIIMMALISYMLAVIGLDMNVSPVSIVLGILLVPLIGGKSNVREITQMQTTASAVASLMAGFSISYIAALWYSEDFNLFVPVAIALLSAAAGIVLVTIVRTQFLTDPGLRFPQSIICITALENVDNFKGKPAKILIGSVVVGVIFAFLQNILHVISVMFDFSKFLPEGMTMGFMLMPMLIGLGYVLGPKACAFLFLGSLLSNILLAPIGTSAGWYISPAVDYSQMQNFNVPLFVGLSLSAMIVPLFKQWRSIKNAFKIDLQASKESSKEISLKWYIVIGALCMVGLMLIFWLYYGANPFIISALLIVAIFFALIALRVASETGLGALLPLALTLTAITYLLTQDVVVSLMMSFAANCFFSLAGNTMMDLKTGYDVGANPQKQVWAQFIGIVPGAICGLVFLYLLINSFGLHSDYATYPFGKMFYAVATGLSGEAGDAFHVGRLLIGVGSGAVLSLVGLPAAIFGISLYLAPATIAGIALGGLIRWILTKRLGQERAKVYDNASVGLILGDTLVTIGLTVFTFFSA